jgi:hypothetical protein
MRANRLFAIVAALLVLGAPAAAQKPTPTPRPAKPTATPAPPVLPKGIDGFEGHLQIDWSKVPRDKAGRPVGFGNMPLVNYSPTMITGKPCPRMARWGTRAVDPATPAVRVVDNPCVIQNLIDDIAPALWFFPNGWDTETYQKVVRPLVQRNEPLFRNGVSWSNSSYMGPSVAQRWQNWRYFVCDKPVYLLVDISGDQLIDQRANDTGRMFQVWFFLTTPDFSPFSCRSYSHKDGKLLDELVISEAEMNGTPPARVTIPHTILYEDGRWRIAGVETDDSYPVKNYREFLARLMPK